MNFNNNILDRILNKLPYTVLVAVETGAAYGVTTRLLAKRFQTVFAVEYSKAIFPVLVGRCPQENIVTIYGDSAEVLPHLASSIRYHCLWYLDAHWCSGKSYGEKTISDNPMPLLQELKVLGDTRPPRDIIVVDDVHAFGREKKPSDLCGWEDITTESICRVLEDRHIHKTTIGDQFIITLLEQ